MNKENVAANGPCVPEDQPPRPSSMTNLPMTQQQYDNDPILQELLHRAAQSPTVERTRRERS